jgi:hypothetical protein
MYTKNYNITIDNFKETKTTHGNSQLYSHNGKTKLSIKETQQHFEALSDDGQKVMIDAGPKKKIHKDIRIGRYNWKHPV